MDDMSVQSDRSWRRWLVVESHVVRLPDGSAVTLVAKPAGYPVVESLGRMALPPSIDLLYDIGRYLRYRIGYRGAWAIHVLAGDLSRGGLRDADELRTLPALNRKSAKELVQQVGHLLRSRGLGALADIA